MIGKYLVLIAGASLMIGGCVKGDPEVSPDQEKTFRTPNKEIPPDIQEKINAARNGGKPPAAAVPTSGGG